MSGVFEAKEDKTNRDFSQYSPLVLAYMGDAVYELFVRRFLVSRENMPVAKLHKSATALVKAKGQSDRFLKVEAMLSEEEAAVFRRGRNAKSHVPKNADMADYKRATGVEALLGYLYLSGREERLTELIEVMLCEDEERN